jgi:CTP:molybdopterin cytidylyltransferase MocA
MLLCGKSPGRHLAAALRSAIRQTYANVEVMLVGGGNGQAERVVAAAATDDPRVVVPLAPAGAGMAPALNDALAHARGMYVCYLHEDDLLHPQHVASLAAALEGPTDSRAAYADVYRTICRPAAGGGREVLGKVLREARDFDPFLLLHRNYIPLTGLMHRRDLTDRAGAFRTDLRAMIEWDFIRRLAFFTDFLHVPAVTAEACAADEDADADRDVDADGQPLGPEELAEATCRVWAARPAKPWPRMHDLSVILAPADEEPDLPARIAEIRHALAVPYTLYLAVPDCLAAGLAPRVGKPHHPAASPFGDPACQADQNLLHVPVKSNYPWDARVDRALQSCQGDCVAILPQRGWLAAPRIAQAVYALTGHTEHDEGLLLKAPRPGSWGAVLRSDELRRARSRRAALTVRRSIEADGIALRMPAPHELPFALDQAAREALAHETDGNFAQAADIYLGLAAGGSEPLWAGQAAAEALFHEPARWLEALTACREVNRRRPTVASLLLEARLCRKNHHADRAAALLERARDLLDWTTDTTDRKGSPC